MTRSHTTLLYDWPQQIWQPPCDWLFVMWRVRMWQGHLSGGISNNFRICRIWSARRRGLLIRQLSHARHTIACNSSSDTCDLTGLLCPRKSHRFNANPVSLSWKPSKTLLTNLFPPLDSDVACDDLVICSQRQICALCFAAEKLGPANVFQPFDTKRAELSGSAEVAIDQVISHLKSPHTWARLNVTLLAMALSSAHVTRIWLDKWDSHICLSN